MGWRLWRRGKGVVINTLLTEIIVSVLFNGVCWICSGTKWTDGFYSIYRYRENMGNLLKWMPKLIITTIEEMFLQILMKVVRVIGMVTFHW